MKFRRLIWLGLLAGTGYKVYQNRQAIAQKIVDVQNTVTEGQETLATLQSQSQDLTNQVPQLNQLADNLNYKLRVFEQESKPHIEAISTILAKYQKKED